MNKFEKCLEELAEVAEKHEKGLDEVEELVGPIIY